MKRARIFIAVLVVAGAAGLFLYFWQNLAGLYNRLSLSLPQLEKGISDLIQKAEKQILIPPPLVAEREAPESVLTQGGIIPLVNEERAKLGLSALKESQILDESAAAKVADMFANQYFAHDSPSGLGVGDLAEAAGYDYLIIGENLALGNFENDQDLIHAWMDSEGHRANILNINYQEIGVSVQKGVYQGKSTWLAVQHFGKPLSSCPQPQEKLKIQIESSQGQLAELQETLKSLQTELQKMSRGDRQAYNQKAKEYNELVAEYNKLVTATKNLVVAYNEQVKKFNSCASGN
jgi:hypothetical protein